MKTTLLIMAAGIGSRFGGGIKQLEPVGLNDEIIMDYSVHDAIHAGFNKIIFVIRKEIEEDFRRRIGDRIQRFCDRMGVEVAYAFQDMQAIPAGFGVPEGRVKPWGTGHAVLCCKGAIDGPFAVINSDDYYGRSAYQKLYEFLTSDRPGNEHAMVAYLLKNTVTENGSVARGVCQVEDGYLTDVVERTKIFKDGENGRYTEDGETFHPLSGNVPVSMNCWAFGQAMLQQLADDFPAWLDENLPKNPEKCEYFLPFVVNDMVKAGKGKVKVLNCDEAWYGVTYKEDMDSVVSAIKKMRAEGIYPEALLD